MCIRTASAPPELLSAIFGALSRGPITRQAVYLAVADAVRCRSLTATADGCLRQAVGSALIAGRLLSAKQVAELGLVERRASK